MYQAGIQKLSLSNGGKMKVGIITDIHNNAVALKKVLERLKSENCDKIICCGDIIGIGPYPEETVQIIMKIPNLIAVRGNHEGYLLGGLPEEYTVDLKTEQMMDLSEFEYHKWEHSMLSESSVDFLSRLPYKQEFTLANKRITVMHYCMNDKNKYINYTPNAGEEALKKMFADYDSEIILYGHDHSRMIKEVNSKWYINVGSLGCPAADKNIARAGILEIIGSDVSVKNVDIKYDVSKVIDEINRIDFPAAKEIKMFFYGVK